MGFSNKLDGMFKTLPAPIQEMLHGMGPQASEALEQFLKQRAGNGAGHEKAAVAAAAGVPAKREPESE
jgi:hypothetical protein